MFKAQKHEARTLSWWHRQKENIDFSPPYQRMGGVWMEKNRAYLIDSIINGFDLPKIYLADFRYANSKLNVKQLPFAVIDGKQRLEAIFSFLEDKLKLSNDFVYYADPNIALAGFTYSDIKSKHPDIAYDVIEQFNLDVVSIITDEEDKIKELFIRLNQGSALKGAEVRNALSGHIPDYVRKICESDLFRKSGFSKKRGQDKNAAAKLCLIAVNNKFVSTKKRDLDHFFSTYNGDKNNLLDELLVELNELGKLFENNDPSLKREALIPVIYMLYHKNKHYTLFIAEFLQKFTSELRSAKNRDSDDSFEIVNTHDAAKFEGLIRNANDQSGLSGAYEIMHKVLEQYIANQI